MSWERAAIGFPALEKSGSTLPDDAFEIARRADGTILGPVSHNDYPPAAEGGLNPSGRAAQAARPLRQHPPRPDRPGLPPRCGRHVDLVIVRENTEGFYADRNMFAGGGEFMPTPDVALVGAQDHARRPRCASPRPRSPSPRAPAQEGDRRAQGQRAAACPTGCSSTAVREVAARLPGRRVRGDASSTRWPRCWCAMPAASTSS